MKASTGVKNGGGVVPSQPTRLYGVMSCASAVGSSAETWPKINFTESDGQKIDLVRCRPISKHLGGLYIYLFVDTDTKQHIEQ